MVTHPLAITPTQIALDDALASIARLRADLMAQPRTILASGNRAMLIGVL